MWTDLSNFQVHHKNIASQRFWVRIFLTHSIHGTGIFPFNYPASINHVGKLYKSRGWYGLGFMYVDIFREVVRWKWVFDETQNLRFKHQCGCYLLGGLTGQIISDQTAEVTPKKRSSLVRESPPQNARINSGSETILLMAEILHQQGWWLSHC